MKRVLALAALALMFVGIASAQNLVSSPATTTLTYNSAESITVSVDTANLALTTSPQSIGVTTTWSLLNTRTQVVTAAYFSSSAALTGSGGNIDSSSILGQGIDPEGPCNSSLNVFGTVYPEGCDLVRQNAATIEPDRGDIRRKEKGQENIEVL